MTEKKTVWCIMNIQTRVVFGIFSTRQLAEETKIKLRWLTEGYQVQEIEVDYYVRIGA